MITTGTIIRAIAQAASFTIKAEARPMVSRANSCTRDFLVPSSHIMAGFLCIWRPTAADTAPLFTRYMAAAATRVQ